MKAFCFEEHGSFDNLKISSIETPVPGPTDILVRLHAAALNRLDLWVLKGWPGLRLEMPHIPGADGAGEITAVGEQVRGFKPGDRIVINPNISCGSCPACQAGQDNLCRNWHLLGETIRGTFAECVCIPASSVLPLPTNMPYRDAAAASLVFLTAWHSLITRGKLLPGEKVLIIGASGGVNTASIQIAKLAGARVFVVGSSREKLELAESLGADELIDRSTDEAWSREAYTLSGKQGFDVVIDNVGEATFSSSLRSLRKGGRLLTVGNTSGHSLELDNRFIFGKHLSILGSTMGTKADFRKVMQLIFDGQLRAVLDRQYTLENAREAFLWMDTGRQLGKITIEIK